VKYCNLFKNDHDNINFLFELVEYSFFKNIHIDNVVPDIKYIIECNGESYSQSFYTLEDAESEFKGLKVKN
jgi:hypothetical protein